MNKPASWIAVNGMTRRDTCKLSEEFGNELGKMSGRCLDVGSGPGDVVVDFILPKLNSDVSIVCSDISEEMVNFAKERYKDNRRVSFIKLDIESPNLPDDLIGEFDHVTSEYCLHWCHDVRQALENIFNLLRPGGTALFTFMADLIIYDAWEAMAKVPQYQPYMKDKDRYITEFHHNKQPLETLQTLLGETGFEVHDCSLTEKTWIVNTIDALDQLLLAVDPFVDVMPSNLQDVYRKDLVKYFPEDRRILSKDDASEAGYSLLYHPFLVYATKPVVV